MYRSKMSAKVWRTATKFGCTTRITLAKTQHKKKMQDVKQRKHEKENLAAKR
jgi:hypothetical protein